MCLKHMSGCVIPDIWIWIPFWDFSTKGIAGGTIFQKIYGSCMRMDEGVRRDAHRPKQKKEKCERGRRSASGSPIYLSAPPVLCQPMSNTLLHFSSAALWNVDTKKGCRANAKADRLQCHPMSNTLHVLLLWSAFLFMVHQLCIEKII